MTKTLLAALALSLPLVLGAPMMSESAANAATVAHKVASPAKKKATCKATKSHSCKKATHKKAAATKALPKKVAKKK
ncbi:hypothetical protein [Rhizobium sp.]